MTDYTKPWSREEKMLNYGLTEEDMEADVDLLSEDKCYWRFHVEFGGSFGCDETGDYGYFDGKHFRLRPDNVTDEDENALIKESLKEKKDLFIEQWTEIVQYDDDDEY